jgi:hypothetical protein
MATLFRVYSTGKWVSYKIKGQEEEIVRANGKALVRTSAEIAIYYAKKYAEN